MSNIVPIDFSSVPAFARGKSAVSQALDDSLAGGVKRLSIRGGAFRYVVGGQEVGKIEERYIDVVLVNAAPHVSRTWYAKEYDKDAKPEAPDCWSVDGAKPDERAKNKQHDNCAGCAKNVKGSGKIGQSKACRYSQRLAVVLANDINGEVLQLTLPATSIFGEASTAGHSLQGYYKSLAARSIDPAALVTRMRFDTDVEAPKLGFTAINWLTEAQYGQALEQGKSDAAVRAITMTVFEADGVDAGAPVALPSGTPPQPPAATAPAASGEGKKEKVEKTATVDEPVVRKSVDVTQATNPKLAALVAEWTDDNN